MPAYFVIVVKDQVRISPLRPALRRRDDVVRESANRNRDGDVLGTKVGLGEPLPIKTSRRNGRVGQPEKRGVVEDIVSRKASWLSVKSTCDELQTGLVV